MKRRRALLFLVGAATAVTLVIVVTMHKPPPASSTAEPALDPEVITLQLNWAGLAGRPSHMGTIGTGAGQARGFVGEYIVASDSIVLRARAEVQNKPPLGSPEGNVAAMFVDPSDPGVGVGSIADVGKPGSEAISGGGPHGSEIIHVISSGDPLIVEPRYMGAATIRIRISDYRISSDDVSLVLHPAGGAPIVIPPSVVEPRLIEIGSDAYELRVADLPGLQGIDVLTRFDVRSGWFNGSSLSGGHFWLTSVIFGSAPRVPIPSEQYD